MCVCDEIGRLYWSQDKERKLKRNGTEMVQRWYREGVQVVQKSDEESIRWRCSLGQRSELI